ncbi:MAG: methylmalonyl Co-A mutase-associated GTPase MeaB [Flavobacteriia bacterium]|nr:methylmalonyl Co-A mutase-associated GTPase MeaB [Flavobacteriia bacterium]OJX34946.1 MAG: ATPase/protein kinase [Flavobacteriia bacterium 40-80]
MNDQHLNKWFENRKKRLDSFSSGELLEGILNKDINRLSQAITLVESSRPDHQKAARELVEKCLPYTGKSIRVGITGVPGVGKSTFIESFGKVLTDTGHRVAVLAVDPSSNVTGGSILGDKTRMNDLATNPNVFIRPSPSGDSLGGVAKKTRETIFLCEAAGYDIILVETVGVGQSEVAVHSMVDFFLLLMLAGAGDELQGIKRGIMEMADALVITKADGDNRRMANVARQQYEAALHLFPPTESTWIPKVLTCSAYENLNLDKVWKVIEEYVTKTRENNYFFNRRKKQDKYWLKERINELLLNDFYGNELLMKSMKQTEQQVEEGKKSSFSGADELYQLYKNQ